MTEPRAYTADEVRDQIIEHVWTMARYWAGLDGSNVPADATPLDRTTGLAHSLLVTLDGSTMNLPAFKLVPDPAPEDEAYLKGEGQNWYDPANVVQDTLHEHLYRADLRRDQP